MNKYMQAQKKKIEIDKWNEGFRIKKDPGQAFVLDWIEKNAAFFQVVWEEALCSNCYFAEECGYKLKKSCEKFNSIK